jgi:tRNA-Thr(GGU) m(6)t(6)A37 methyltransferase TsaA
MDGEEQAAPVLLRPIGVVRSPVRERGAMPGGGVPATVEVFPDYRAGLVDIASNSHLIVLAWLHLAERDRLQAAGRHAPPGAPLRGVFGLRSQMRPNPIGCTVARLLAADLPAGRLDLDLLDFLDGTPVLDLKRYSPAIDAVFAARTSRDFAAPPPDLRDDLARAAVQFHGEWCAGAAVGVALLAAALLAWGCAARHPDLRVQVGADGCLADALQGMTGATLGNGRLTVAPGPTVTLRYPPHTWTFTPAYAPASPDTLLAQPLAALGRLDTHDDGDSSLRSE